MSKITFVVSEPGTRNSIFLFYTCHDGRLKYYTGERGANLDHLNKGAEITLNKIRTHIERLEVDYKIKGEPMTKDILKASLDKLLHKKVRSRVGDMFDAMTSLVDRMESGEALTPGKKRYSPGSIKTFRFTVSLLRRFAPGLSLASTDQGAYGRFITWMQGEGYSLNYIGSQVKNWKTLGKGIGGTVFDEPWFKKMQEDATDIYLNEEELKRIFDLRLSGRHDIARDWFMLDCYTGLRVSDLMLLDKHNLSGSMITIANKKTGEKVVIPMHPVVKKILKKHGGFPPPLTDVAINLLIKQVGEKAEINDQVLFTITKGGRRKDQYLKKWQAISNHTARRSFITNLLKNGVPDTIVMSLTGIKSPATLKKYNKLGTEEAAKIAAGHKFFK